ncbi:MAG: amidohydrolase family protein [Pseudomonadota bacterium]
MTDTPAAPATPDWITNCHIHVFTLDHVPNGFLPLGAIHLLRQPYVRTPLLWLAERRIMPATLRRAARFGRISALGDQREVFHIVQRYYPKQTRFVILPMDMAFMGKGDPPAPLAQQHDDLAEIRDESDGCAIPFAAVDPRRPDAMEELSRCVETLKFEGLKLYPPLGYPPTHPVLMERIYPYCIEHNLPVMTHCSRGGVTGAGLDQRHHDKMAAPDAFAEVLDRFPTLRVCLAHFGGERDWNDYLQKPKPGPLQKATNRIEENWVSRVLDLVVERDTLWTDISYTAFNFSQNLPALNVFLTDPRVARRVLFGSDYFMTETEATGERRMSIEVRAAIGEARFDLIAKSNPVEWLTGANYTGDPPTGASASTA